MLCSKSSSTLLEEAQKAFAPLLSYGFTLENTAKMMDYWEGLQKLAEFPKSYWYQRASWLEDVPDDVEKKIIEHFCKYAGSCPVTNNGSAIIVQPLQGKLLTMPNDLIPTSEMLRRTLWIIVVIVEFPKGSQDPGLRERCINWVREAHSVVEPYALRDPAKTLRRTKSGKLYDDHLYLSNDYWHDVLGDIYGSNLPRLTKLKRKYDPDNVFQLNRKIITTTARREEQKVDFEIGTDL